MEANTEDTNQESFASTLERTEDLNEDTAQTLRKKLLTTLNVGNEWSLIGESSERCVDGSGDWELFTLSHNHDHDRNITVIANSGARTIQTYLEPAGVFTEPDQNTTHIQTALSDK
jgi:hypothetical protein